MVSATKSTLQAKKRRGRPRKIETDLDTEIPELNECSRMHRTPPPGIRETQREHIEANAVIPENRQHVSTGTSMMDADGNFPDLAQLSLLEEPQRRVRSFMDLSKVLPNFELVNLNANIYQSIDKIEEYVSMYGWDEIATKHYALSKLEVVARKWKDSLPRADRTWQDWKVLLIKTFPSEDITIKKVLDAQNYKRMPNQNIVEYFYEKLSRCNTARMQNQEIIEWIVNGLGNDQYRSYQYRPISTSLTVCESNRSNRFQPDLKSGDSFIKEYSRPIIKSSFPRKGQHFGSQRTGYSEKSYRDEDSEKKNESRVVKAKVSKEIICFICV